MFVITPLVVFIFVWSKAEKIKNADIIEFKAKFGTLIDESVTDKGFFGLLYYSLFTFRRLVFAISQIFFKDYTVQMISLNCALGLIQIVYQIKYFPFNDKLKFTTYTISEISILVCFICALIIANFSNHTAVQYSEKTFCYCILAFMLYNCVVILYHIGFNIWKILKKEEKKRAIRFMRTAAISDV